MTSLDWEAEFKAHHNLDPTSKHKRWAVAVLPAVLLESCHLRSQLQMTLLLSFRVPLSVPPQLDSQLKLQRHPTGRGNQTCWVVLRGHWVRTTSAVHPMPHGKRLPPCPVNSSMFPGGPVNAVAWRHSGGRLYSSRTECNVLHCTNRVVCR
jgi:hypothetical protein